MPVTLDLVPADAGKRLGAAVLDWLAPFVVLTVLSFLAFAGTPTSSRGYITHDAPPLVLLGSIAGGFTLAYIVVLMAVEARSGNTIGNRLMGIRSTDPDGFAPGAGAVFLRGLVTGAGVLVAILAAVVVVWFQWFGVGVLILAPLALLGAGWAILVEVSSTWDRNGKRQGWHDAAAKTLAFDVKAGRNPVTTGGIAGPYRFAPLDLPPVQQVASPLARAADAEAAPVLPGPALPGPVVGAPAPVSFQPVSFQQASGGPAAHPDDDLDRTQVRGNTQAPVTVAMLRILLDDGRDIQLERAVLLGRNPAGRDGEESVQLISLADPGRSISKTHLHLRAGNGGVWVTDRNSTNGSAVTTPDGIRAPLAAGEPTHVRPGSTVHFGDRSFYLGQA